MAAVTQNITAEQGAALSVTFTGAGASLENRELRMHVRSKVGVITTKLLKTGFGMAGASVESGARTSVFCATSKSVGVSGTYYSDAREVPCSPHANDPALEKAVYEKSCALLDCAPV